VQFEHEVAATAALAEPTLHGLQNEAPMAL
jgi:hypothetical protein